MINPNDRMKITTALQDYEKIKSNYHFNNWELTEMSRCEEEIKDTISVYEDNIEDLAELVSAFPGITKFISKEKLDVIKDSISPTNEESVYYSLDGKKHATLDEALDANEQLMTAKKQVTR